MKLYFLGIGGTAMGNLAIMLKSLGHDIFGADEHVYSPMSDLLSSAGIKYFEGYSKEHISLIHPDLVVVGNVMSRGNVEVEWLLSNRMYRYTSLPQLIRDYIIVDRQSIVVTGTHGKTTTTSLITYLLQQCGLRPGYFIGGAPINFPTGADVGHIHHPFVIEGDEYDSAFFDKRSKFVHYMPHILIINNIELDHIDIFRDIDDIKRTFSHVIRLVPENGYIIANGDDSIVRELLPVKWTNTYFLGVSAGNDFRICHAQMGAHGSTFELHGDEKVWHIKSPLYGEHNMRNVSMSVLASYLASKQYTPSVDLLGFLGVRKRQEVVYISDQFVVISDFAHHPTAIKETIHAVKQAYPGYKLVTLFEPRSNTACSGCFQSEFQRAFIGSDCVYLTPIFKSRTVDVLDISRLVSAIDYCPSFCASIDELKQTLVHRHSQERTIFLCLSNGNFDNLPYVLSEQLNTKNA